MFERLDAVLLRYEDIGLELASPDVVNNNERFRRLMKEQSDLTPLVDAYREYKRAGQDIADSLELLDAESDADMREMAKEEL